MSDKTETDPRDRIAAENAAERERLGETLDQLRDSLAPADLLRRGAGLAARSALPLAARTAGGAARLAWRNPLASLLIGAGVAVLVTDARKPKQAARQAEAAEAQALKDRAWIAGADAQRALSAQRLDEIDAAERDGAITSGAAEARRTQEMQDLRAELDQSLRGGLGHLSPAAQERVAAARAAELARTIEGENGAGAAPWMLLALAGAVGIGLAALLPRGGLDAGLGRLKDQAGAGLDAFLRRAGDAQVADDLAAALDRALRPAGRTAKED